MNAALSEIECEDLHNIGLARHKKQMSVLRARLGFGGRIIEPHCHSPGLCHGTGHDVNTPEISLLVQRQYLGR